MTLFQLTRGAVRLSAVFMLQRANNGPAVMERLSNTLKHEHNLTYILLQEVRLGDKISLIECLLSSITCVRVSVCVPVSLYVCVHACVCGLSLLFSLPSTALSADTCN